MKKMFFSFFLICLLCMAISVHAADTFGPFSAEDLLTGYEYTEADFEEPYITLINFWATWCPPCIAELPDLAQIYDITGGKVQVISVLIDGVTQRGTIDNEAVSAMTTLASNAGVAYPVLLPDAYLQSIGNSLEFVPTTYVVDFEGEIYDIIVGSNTADAWIDIAQEALNAIYTESVDLRK